MPSVFSSPIQYRGREAYDPLQLLADEYEREAAFARAAAAARRRSLYEPELDDVYSEPTFVDFSRRSPPRGLSSNVSPYEFIEHVNAYSPTESFGGRGYPAGRPRYSRPAFYLSPSTTPHPPLSSFGYRAPPRRARFRQSPEELYDHIPFRPSVDLISLEQQDRLEREARVEAARRKEAARQAAIEARELEARRRAHAIKQKEAELLAMEALRQKEIQQAKRQRAEQYRKSLELNALNNVVGWSNVSRKSVAHSAPTVTKPTEVPQLLQNSHSDSDDDENLAALQSLLAPFGLQIVPQVMRRKTSAPTPAAVATQALPKPKRIENRRSVHFAPPQAGMQAEPVPIKYIYAAPAASQHESGKESIVPETAESRRRLNASIEAQQIMQAMRASLDPAYDVKPAQSDVPAQASTTVSKPRESSPAVERGRSVEAKTSSPAPAPALTSIPIRIPVRSPSPPSKPKTPLESIEAVEEKFVNLNYDFIFPSHPDFAQTSTKDDPELLYTPTNAPIRQYEHNLTGLLTQLDAIESEGVKSIREARKGLVLRIETALENLEKSKADAWSKQQAEHEDLTTPTSVVEAKEPVPSSANEPVEAAVPADELEGFDAISAVIDTASPVAIDVVKTQLTAEGEVAAPDSTLESPIASTEHTIVAPTEAVLDTEVAVGEDQAASIEAAPVLEHVEQDTSSGPGPSHVEEISSVEDVPSDAAAVSVTTEVSTPADTPIVSDIDPTPLSEEQPAALREEQDPSSPTPAYPPSTFPSSANLTSPEETSDLEDAPDDESRISSTTSSPIHISSDLESDADAKAPPSIEESELVERNTDFVLI